MLRLNYCISLNNNKNSSIHNNDTDDDGKEGKR